MSRPTLREAPTRRFERKREVILEAAARIFNRNGLHGGTLADVAAQVGLISNSVTYYYRHKEDLAAACLLRATEVVHELLEQAGAHSDPADRVRAYLRGWVRLLADIETGRRGEIITFNEMRALPEKHAEAVFTAYNELFRAVRRLLPEDEGLDRQQRNARAHLLLSLTSWMRAWIQRYERADYERIADRVADLLIHGLAVRPSQWSVPRGPEIGWPRVAGVPTGGPGGLIGPAARELSAASGRGVGTTESATSEAYLRVATLLVNDHGYRGASIERISAMLNLTKGSFYHHHETKDGLILACFERSFEVVRQTQNRAAERNGSGWDRLTMGARALVRFQLSEQGPLLRITARNALPGALRDERMAEMNRLTERFGQTIVDGMQDGSIRPVDPAVAAQLVAGMINAASELKRWVPGVSAENAVSLYARPLFVGLLLTGPDSGAEALEMPPSVSAKRKR